MKKIIIVATLIFAAATLYAQPRAIGGRLGAGLEVSYQHTVGENANFIEADLGLAFIGLGVDGICAYNFMIAQPDWSSKGQWGFYAGPAANVGYSAWGGQFGTGHIGVGGQIGLEYTFDFPLQISLDMRPTLGVRFGSGYVGFYGGGLWGFIPSLSLRYRFGWKK